MTRILLASLIFALEVHAQTATPTPAKPDKSVIKTRAGQAVLKSQGKSGLTPAPGTVVGVAPRMNPVAPPSAWKFSYFGEYQGPALGNFQIGRTQYPGKPEGYTEWDHYLKVAYGAGKNVTLGTQIRAFNSTAPTKDFGFYDLRLFTQWSHMIETSDIDMSGKLTVELPTTDASRTSGKIVAFKFDENFTLKTTLRNWNFSADLLIKPTFFNDPQQGGSGTTDLYVGIFPYITMDMVPNIQLLFEGSFDANHNYIAAAYDLTSAGNDYVDIGPLFTINSHMNSNVAFRIFTDEITFKATALYLNVEVVL